MESEREGPAGLNAKQRIVVILANILILAELTWSIYLGSQDPEEMTVVFLRSFIPMVIGTVVLARVLTRRLRAK
ncbi:MAG: hypothetical protein ACUVXD_13650 [Thermodesulfobacteriota bacterium]